MEDEETLKTSTHVGYLADPVQYEVDDLLAQGVVATRVIVCGVFLARDQLLGVEQLMIRSRTYLV